MASDTRLNYHNDIIVDGKRCQEIVAIADCIQKTFFIKKAKIGIQFLGIGYFADGNEKYPLNHFIKELEELPYVNNIKVNCRKIYDYITQISTVGDTGNYVKGIMSGFMKKKSFVCIFNTYNDNFQVKALDIGQFVDSENDETPISSSTEKAQKEIIERIRKKSKVKWWNIGEDVEVLAITLEKAVFLSKSSEIFNGNMTSLIEKLRFSPKSISGRIVSPPYIEEYNL